MNVPRARARELTSRFRGTPILVVGDLMLDRFIVGQVSRISPEAPVPVVRFQSEYVRLGGAANVAHNLAALGAQVSLAGVIGPDAAGARLRRELASLGIGADGLVEDPDRPTIEKVRIVTGRNQQVARIDYERDDDVEGDAERWLLEQVARLARGARAFLVSDYSKGAITAAIMNHLVSVRHGASPAIPLIVDPKIPHLSRYAGASLITPNHHEAEAATHRRIRTDAEAREAAADFRALTACESALITRGEHGMWLSSPGIEAAIPAVAREVSDVTGAGDTVVATLALGLAAGATLLEAAVLANHAASIVVGKFGPATVNPDELLETF